MEESGMAWSLRFVKMHGAGNDFILVDGRSLPPAGLDRARIAALCHRRRGVGADGLLVIRPDREADFNMTYYNRDGGEAEMCGNGARCAVSFAQQIGLAGESCRFTTSAGELTGKVVDDEVSVSLPPWRDLKCDLKMDGSPFPQHHFVNTGVPHLVIPVPDVAEVDLMTWGPTLRNHPLLGPAGANVDWIQTPTRDGEFALRTYERGVEAETQACGTGAAAVAVVLCHLGLASSPVLLRTQGGDRLVVSVNLDPQESAVALRGPAVVSFAGEVQFDA